MSGLDSVPLDDRLAAVVTDLVDVDEWENGLGWADSAVTGDDSTERGSGEVAGVLKRLFEMEEKSESSAERKEALDEALDMEGMSGALSAWRFVVDRSSVGREILERWIVPAGNLKEASEDGEVASYCRLARLVKALASAMVDQDV